MKKVKVYILISALANILATCNVRAILKFETEVYTEMKLVNAVSAGGSVKFFASGVNFSRNNAIYDINDRTKYILS